jgi:hypothetical protein
MEVWVVSLLDAPNDINHVEVFTYTKDQAVKYAESRGYHLVEDNGVDLIFDLDGDTSSLYAELIKLF